MVKIKRKRESIIQDPLLSFHLKGFQNTSCSAHQKCDFVLGHEHSRAKQKNISFLLFNPFLLKLKIITQKIHVFFFSENTPEALWIKVTLTATVSKVFKNNHTLHHSHYKIQITWKRKRNFAFNPSSHTSFSCILKINSIPWCDFPLPIQHFKSTWLNLYTNGLLIFWGSQPHKTLTQIIKRSGKSKQRHNN